MRGHCSAFFATLRPNLQSQFEGNEGEQAATQNQTDLVVHAIDYQSLSRANETLDPGRDISFADRSLLIGNIKIPPAELGRGTLRSLGVV
jgi:hypothetical protein